LPSFKFNFAPKSTTTPGLSFLVLTASGASASNYAPIAPLSVAILSDKCQVNNDASYTFPNGTGGVSLPYVIDFSSC
jgi:hypothetical protein